MPVSALKYLFGCLFLLGHGFAQVRSQPGSSAALGFEENKGQFCDERGNPVEQALYKVSTSFTDIWVTSKGLTYVFKNREDVALATGKLNKDDTSTVKVRFSRTD